MPLDYNHSLIQTARRLRNGMTPQERKLWYGFLSGHNTRFQRQKVIGNFIVDFYCHQAHLVIELDGRQHRDAQGIASDQERDVYLTGLGLTVLRLTNQEIDYAFAETCKQIDRLCDNGKENKL